MRRFPFTKRAIEAFALRLQFMPILFVLTIFISDIACFRKGLMQKFISIRK